MIYATHIPKRERKRALRDVYAMEPAAPKFNPWSSCPITFDRRDHPTSIRHGGFATLVLDPIIDRFHVTRVLMDGGNSLNLLYQDIVRKMGIDPSRIKPTKTTFKGVIPCNAPDTTFHIRNSNSWLFRRCYMIFPSWLGFCLLICILFLLCISSHGIMCIASASFS